jgi:A-macroglobulin TED domain/Alpha-2-macroglobulin family/A-macroglobulin receptor binding domain/MG2 domain/Alpha-2-macroglobulin bait region domain
MVMKRTLVRPFSIGAFLALIAVPLLVVAAAGQGEAAGQGDAPWLDRGSIEAVPTDAGLEVRCVITNPTNTAQKRPLEVTVAKLDGTSVLVGKQMLSLDPGTNACSLVLRGDLPSELAPLCVLKYQLGELGKAENGARNLIDAMAQLETRLVAYRDLMAGSTASVRLVAMNHANQQPVDSADVAIMLAVDDKERLLFTGKTGADGSIEARFDVPEDVVGDAELRISVAAKGLGDDRIVQRVQVTRAAKILLTTDKPLYQPGQLIQIRALCLRTADLKPEANQTLLYEVMDAKGNKVFKKKTDTGEFGVASATFQLASEVTLGGYIVRAVLGDTTTEKQVTVDKYVLPKFKVNAKTDRDYYLPGETLNGEIQADYFFGKPVAGGRVHVTASKFEIEFTEFASLEGQLDENGHWEFELPLPKYFAGTPIEQGQASVRLEVEVIDTADHREEKVTMTPVAAAPLNMFAVPESGALVPNLDNRVYVLVSYPDGSPASGASVLVSGPGVDNNRSQKTADALGIATIVVKPDGPGELTLALQARDKQGRNVEKRVALSTKAMAESLIVRTDKTLYQFGDTLNAQIFTNKTKGTVYFDLVRAGQTVMTRTAELEAGKAALAMDMDATMSGSVVLQAYMFTPGTDLIRDTRLLYVNPADALQIGIELERDTYKPGDSMQIRFATTNAAGTPTPSAIGVAIVDESVFALQEIHPGLEKVYFTLEQEIMKPRYEIHGYAIDDLVTRPMPIPKPGVPEPAGWSEEQQKAARVLLASAEAVPEPPVRVNTFDTKRGAADEAIVEQFTKDFEHIHKSVMRYLQRHEGKAPKNLLGALLRLKYLRPSDIEDPWGTPYEFDFSHVQDWGGFFTMASNGPDGTKGSDDDISPETPMGQRVFAGGARGGLVLGAEMRGRGDIRMMKMAEGVPMAMPDVDKEEAMPLDSVAVTGAVPSSGEPQVRIREYFPETLLFEPALITDAQGMATLDIDLADTITTWRMTTMASSRGGALGSREAPLRVFQDFFVDIDLPVALTQHDQVSIPVVVYNYLDKAQDVRLKFETEPWFKLDGDAEPTLTLQPEEVRAMYFPIEVVELGKHRLTVFAYGTNMNDAIRREIEVLPDGEEKNVSFSDRLTAKTEHTVTIPGNAIAGASKILVRVYPGVFSQIVDGLDSMLRMPSGCFEQTSASLYPNILIVQYMKATEQINPEIQMKAEGFINAGYQRLLAYEVQGGGYSWFGDPPANKVLTAWGFKEFCDMAQVHEVDPAVIDRTRAWLLDQQEADGSWTPDENYLHAESWQGIQGSNVLVTAYIADAILTSGEKPPQIAKAIDYLKANWKDGDDAYTLALVANALVAWDKNDAYTQQVLKALYNLRVEDKDTCHWKGAATVTFTHGDAADIETTALAAIAFLNAGKYPEATGKALTYLIQKKSAQGHWGSTQATILALKALIVSLGNRTEEVDATVTIALNGETVSELKVTPEDSDVMRLVDLGEQTKAGANNVTLNIDGEGSMMYQVVGRYYTPWNIRPQPREPMTIEVAYDKTELAVNDMVTVTAKVTNTRRAEAQMIIVDLGIPPGFQVMVPDLEELVQNKVMDKYELTGRQIITYFQKIGPNATIEFSYKLRAKFPLRAQTPESRVYEYYNPELSGTAEPRDLVVE